ncbi:extracellular solute-binding protein [Vibrio sp. T187]|uniref:ABC transporter substrate-binding protein n=1 Tax=Vibrio TaxID=662 RepID=UPI0010C9AFDC|nr:MULTISPECIES: extracellular solute-binding protein [Vibrio]MBW3696172.1 extracellular solute-binding protein [Vibrio sp. T187]
MKNTLSKACLASAISAALFSTAAMAEKVELDVAAFANYDQVIRLVTPEFEKQYPDIKINLKSLAFADHHTALTTSLSTGSNVPDVAAIEVGFIGRFSNAGGLEDLSKAPYNAGEFTEKFSPFTVPLGQNAKGEQAGLPVDIGPGAIFYRSDVLEKAGVTPEELLKDWDSFVETGKKIKAETGGYLVANTKLVKDIVIRTGLKDGESIYFGPNNEILVESDRFKKAFEVAQDVREAGLDAQVALWSTEWNEGLRRGDIATQMFGSWFVGHLRDFVSPDTTYWRTADLPEQTYASWGGTFLTIPKKAENKEAAWTFIKFLADRVDTQVQALDFGTFPSLIEAQHAPLMDQPMAFLGGEQARVQWRNSASKIPAIKAHKHDPVAEQIIDDALESVLNRGVSIDKALADAAKLIKRRARR